MNHDVGHTVRFGILSKGSEQDAHERGLVT